MKITRFISRRLHFRGRIATVSISVCFLVMIIAVAVSSGFRKEIRDSLSSLAGDVRIVPSTMDFLSGSCPLDKGAAYLPYVDSLPFVESVVPVIYRAGIVRNGDLIHGVLFKASSGAGSGSLDVQVPSRLLSLMNLREGDDMTAYFVGEKVRVRKFRIASVYDAVSSQDDRLVIYADAQTLQRIGNWNDSSVSAFEVTLSDSYRSETGMKKAAEEIGAMTLLYSGEDDRAVVSLSAAESNPELFDWLSLIDFNVWFILILMTVVAAVNMITGLLILLFENISFIGTLKTLGMTDRGIAGVFIRSSSSIVLKGMAVGNVLAFVFCFVQDRFRLIPLDPANYFVSAVPVHISIPWVLAADIAAYLAIMLLLLLPLLFISNVDPAKTVRMS